MSTKLETRVQYNFQFQQIVICNTHKSRTIVKATKPRLPNPIPFKLS